MAKRTTLPRQVRAAGWIDGYRPRSITDSAWDVVRPLVVGALRDAEASRIGVSPMAALVVTKLAAWCVEQGIGLDIELVLDPDTVERFCSSLPDGRSRATYRSLLRRIGPAATKRAPWAPRPDTTGRRIAAAPYMADEIDALARDAEHQATRGRHRAFTAMLCLGAGAGLDGRWVTQVTEDDVRIGDVVTVQVRAPAAREVPVLAGYERPLVELTIGLRPGEALIGGFSTAANRASDLIGRLELSSKTPPLSLARLRSTWLAKHLALGTRLPELAAAAGIERVDVLSDLLRFVEPLAAAEARRMLRGEQ